MWIITSVSVEDFRRVRRVRSFVVRPVTLRYIACVVLQKRKRICYSQPAWRHQEYQWYLWIWRVVSFSRSTPV